MRSSASSSSKVSFSWRSPRWSQTDQDHHQRCLCSGLKLPWQACSVMAQRGLDTWMALRIRMRMIVNESGSWNEDTVSKAWIYIQANTHIHVLHMMYIYIHIFIHLHSYIIFSCMSPNLSGTKRSFLNRSQVAFAGWGLSFSVSVAGSGGALAWAPKFNVAVICRWFGIVWNITIRFHILFHWGHSERRIVKDYIQQG